MRVLKCICVVIAVLLAVSLVSMISFPSVVYSGFIVSGLHLRYEVSVAGDNLPQWMVLPATSIFRIIRI